MTTSVRRQGSSSTLVMVTVLFGLFAAVPAMAQEPPNDRAPVPATYVLEHPCHT